MKPFMDQDFLLENDVAKKLYHEYAENMPIYDYHCHISPRMIYENHQFENIGELMLGGDHYKWRVMLSNGVDEKFIRGDASWHDKWLAFAASLKYCIGNPMFHWTHLELRRVFGIEDILSEKTAEDIWNRANALLATEEYRCRGLIEKFGVKVICTTDDPVDDLEHHTLIEQDATCNFKVYPAWRPDKVLNIERGGFVDYMNRLSRVSGIHCLNLESMMQALEARLDFFHAHGARLSDHALDTVPYGVPSTHIAGEAFRKAMSGAPLTEAEIASYKTYVLVELARMYKARGWAQQYHIGAMRNNNPRMFEKYGADVGFAQCGLRRDYVEGTHTSPVGYLEGVFVQEEYRGRGVATALLRACEAWAGEKGCAEFASDCGLDNAASAVFHLRAGFAEAGRIICFTKRL